MPGTKQKRGTGSWTLHVRSGTDFRGKPIRYTKTVHCKSEAAADRELALFYADCVNGRVNRSTPITVAELADQWYEEYVLRHLKVSARRGIDPAIKMWIKPLLGNKKVSKVQRLDVQKWVNYVSDPQERTNKRGEKVIKQLSPKTVRNYYSALRGMFDFAVDMGIIEDTPCKNIRMPKKDHKEATYFTIEEVSALLEALSALQSDELRYKVAIYLGLFGGLRKGEIMGLNREDVDFERCEVSIRRTRMIKPKEGVYEDTPKTDKSIRTIALPPEVMAEIRRLIGQQKEQKLQLQNQYHDSPALLRNDHGAPLYPQVLQRWFTRFLEKNNLPHAGLHSLRHTHASMLVYLGTDKMQVSTRLGHSQLSTTLNIYTHLFEDADKKVAEDLSSNFLKAR